MNETVFRIVRRRAKPGCERAYEAIVSAMFEEASRFKGYLSAELIPPEAPGGDYQIVQRFATPEDLERWNDSPERVTWHDRLRPVADGDPEYRLLNGLDAWFAPTVLPASRPPKKWRMTLVSWMGIFPTTLPRSHCCVYRSRGRRDVLPDHAAPHALDGMVAAWLARDSMSETC
jgi:antibiotic biosynthesis monooxygenase (ABM) superfamily enzyme